MTRIYTRKGDDGTTSLWYGGRVPKSHPRTEAYGAIDEAVSALGVARAVCGPDDAEIAADILRVQNELFVAGAELATAPRPRTGSRTASAGSPPRWSSGWSGDRPLHGRVELPPKFVIPGGTQLSAQLDVARAVLRRAERRLVELADAEEILRNGRLPQPLLGPRLRDARSADTADPELFEGRG